MFENIIDTTFLPLAESSQLHVMKMIDCVELLFVADLRQGKRTTGQLSKSIGIARTVQRMLAVNYMAHASE